MRQIGRLRQRLAGFLQQGRADHRQHGVAEQAQRRRRGVAVLQVAHGGVEAPALQIDQPRVGRNADVDAGMPAPKIGQARNQPEAGEGLRRGQGHGRLLSAAQLGAGPAQFGKGDRGGTLQALTRRGERQRACLALEEAYRQRRLQGDHLLAHRRLGDEKLLRGTREAQVARGCIEGAQGVERRQIVFTHSVFSWLSRLDVAGRAMPPDQ